MDAAGGKGVILLDHSTDPYDPTAMRASMGTLFTQKLVRTSFNDFAGWILKNQYAVIGTSDAASQDYHDYNYPNPVILMMGSEQKGLQENHLKLCREVVSIPMQGIADSLNVSVAAAVVLFEINHQKRMQK
jgi:TrmH family RNA methyltransferase